MAHCTTDSDCPLYSKCKNFTENEKTYSLCRFEYFLCEENETVPCLYVSTTMWNIKSQSMKKGYEDHKNKLIIKTCPKDRLKSIKNRCRTDECYNDNDCLSGKCYSNNCIFDGKMIYMCSGEEEKSFLRCGKDVGMKVKQSNGCFSKRSYFSYCLVYSNMLLSEKIIIIGLVLYLIYYTIRNLIKKRKNNVDKENNVIKKDNDNKKNNDIEENKFHKEKKINKKPKENNTTDLSEITLVNIEIR